MVVQEHSATAAPVEVTAWMMSPVSRGRVTTFKAYSAAMPNVMGRAMKFRKVTRTPDQPAAPTISSTPSSKVQMAAAAVRAGLMMRTMRNRTAIRDARVAIGPSCNTERIIAPKTTAEPEVSMTLPLGNVSSWSTAAIFSRSLPFQTDKPPSEG